MLIIVIIITGLCCLWFKKKNKERSANFEYFLSSVHKNISKHFKNQKEKENKCK